MIIRSQRGWMRMYGYPLDCGFGLLFMFMLRVEMQGVAIPVYNFLLPGVIKLGDWTCLSILGLKGRSSFSNIVFFAYWTWSLVQHFSVLLSSKKTPYTTVPHRLRLVPTHLYMTFFHFRYRIIRRQETTHSHKRGYHLFLSTALNDDGGKHWTSRTSSSSAP
jgi:hypothetical protein